MSTARQLIGLLLGTAMPLLPGMVGAATSLTWQEGEGYRMAPLKVPATGRTGFTLLAPEQTGIDFTNHLSYERSMANQNLLNGSGVAAGDVNGDGWPDLYFCNLEGPNALYLNRGDGTFQEATAGSGAGCADQASRAAVLADLNGDGHLDLLVSSIGGPNACLLNDGTAVFRDVTATAGMVLKAGGHSYALGDVDNDGDLDVYLANYGENSVLRSGGTVSVRMVNGRPVISGRQASRLKIIDGQLIELGEPDVLYLNNGQAVFSPVSWTGGAFRDEAGQPLAKAPWDMGLSVMFRDINRDSHPDLYVCNDFQNPDRIWINQGDGTFSALPPMALRTTCHFSMGVDFADIDRDGLDDFFVSDMLSRFHHLRMTQVNASNPPPSHVEQEIDRFQVRHNTLLHNRGDGTYVEIAKFAGVHASDWTWSVVFLDVDLDGLEDLLVANGHAYDTQDLDMSEKAPAADFQAPAMRGIKELKDYPPLRTPNNLFRNLGQRRFEEVGQAWGFDHTAVSHGIALADFDLDGDQDVAVSCLWTPPLLYRNDGDQPRLAVRLKGPPGNRQGIGARISVSGGPRPQSQEVVSGGRYLSGDDPMRVFAAGALTNELSIEVLWRDGSRSTVAPALPNHLYEIDHQSARQPEPTAPDPVAAPLFAHATGLLDHLHEERPFNDFQYQPLLPRHLATSGPAVALDDLDQDGDDDLAIGTATGGFLAVFQNDGSGRFQRWPHKAWFRFFADDSAGIVSWSPTPGSRGWLVAQANYERGPGQKPELLFFSPEQPEPTSFPLPLADNVGPLALADYDRDGDLDVFVGGRAAPGQYPRPASSLLLRNDRGRLVPDPKAKPVLQEVGLVNGAVWSDLDGDGWSDLALATEWGPIRVFRNKAGTLEEITSSLGLEPHTGLWQGIAAADLNGDGRMDLVAGNWGLNSHYLQPQEHPPRIYYADFDGNGSLDLLEAVPHPRSGKRVPLRNRSTLAAGIPLLKLWYPTHQAFSQTDVAAILKHANARAEVKSLQTLASTLFLNQGNRFTAHPLPEPAQYAPAFAVKVADFDLDGSEDLFLSQNFFDTRPFDPRLDAGRGLLLRGDGKGGLEAVDATASGIACYGQQRAAAVGDLNLDGKPDLLLTQNGGDCRVYLNQSPQTGLHLQLQGSPANPGAVGAQIRILTGGQAGPAREVHAGSGYWSQDSTGQTFALPDGPGEVLVRWPDGSQTRSAIPDKARRVRLHPDGTITTGGDATP